MMKVSSKKILIRTPNWLGDSVMSIPAVAAAKRLYPDAGICVWTKPGLMDLWRFVPEVDNVIDSVPKKHDFELGILLTNSFSSAFKMYLAKVPERRGYSANLRGFLLTQAVSVRSNLHDIDYFLGIMGGADEGIPRINIPEELKDEAKRFLAGYGWDGETNIIGIHATSSYGPAKCWLKERFSQLIDSLNDWILIVGSSEEKKDIDDILKNVKNQSRIIKYSAAKLRSILLRKELDALSSPQQAAGYSRAVINLAGKTDIRMLAGVINLCSVFIANDSGPMHLASAIGVPVIAIFGSTDPSITGPRGKGIIIKKDLSCSPCFRRVCPKNLECMQMISVEDVLQAVKMRTCPEIGHVRGPSSDMVDIRLAVVMKDYDESWGGAERYLAGVMPQLANEFKAVDLIVNRVKGAPPKNINVKTVKSIRWSSVLAPLSFNWAVQRLIRKSKYNLVYGLTQIYPQDVYRAGGGLEHSWFDIRYKKLWLRLVNYLRLRNIVRLYIENRIFSKGNYKKIITNSNLVKNQILHHYKISPDDVIVVYNGVDKNRFNPDVKTLHRNRVRQELGVGRNDKVILFISNNWKRKGLRELIKALGPDMWLIVVGRGKAKKYGTGNRIIFVGTTDKPERYYGAGDVFVLPTYYDPFANVCIEALSCGLPVITTQTNGASEFIINGKNGYIINDVNDIRELADCINKAFSLQGGIENLTVERNVQQTIEVLKNVQKDVRGDASHILVNNGYRKLLEKKEWINFDSVMKETRGVIYKKNNLRSVTKIDNLFLKRHFKGAKPSWAFREWQNIFRLRSIGIQTMNPVAMGEKGEESFIITESLESAEKLEDFVKKVKLDFSKKRSLIYGLASLTKKLHQNNLFHKDFYTGHIFVGMENNKFKLYVIDIQRLRRHWVFEKRWRIKDLASLNFSSFGGCINNADRIRFLKYYTDRDYKKYVKKILTKTRRIARHTEKVLKQRTIL